MKPKPVSPAFAAAGNCAGCEIGCAEPVAAACAVREDNGNDNGDAGLGMFGQGPPAAKPAEGNQFDRLDEILDQDDRRERAKAPVGPPADPLPDAGLLRVAELVRARAGRRVDAVQGVSAEGVFEGEETG
jgi:hypothetical protein